LTWFGRDPRFEQKLAAWKASDRSEAEPVKTQFVKGFHRGLELYGEHAVRKAAGEGGRSAAGVGLILTEGPNDAIRLHTLGEQAVAACSNTLTREQAERAARLARDVADGTILLLLDCDEEGERGSQQALALLAEYAPVRLGWSRWMHARRYKDRQPESLTGDDWRELLSNLAMS
jgi:DNA primase